MALFDDFAFRTYNDGVTAYLAGRPKTVCSYRPGSKPWKDWCDGWNDGKLFAVETITGEDHHPAGRMFIGA